MFKHLFATMNEVLDEIIQMYPSAGGQQKAELDEQLSVLRSMSDACIEEWLLFEEKMGQLNGIAIPAMPEAAAAGSPAKLAAPKACEDAFQKGQGFYKLYMFDKAADAFAQIVGEEPDFLLARAYLAMSLLRSGQHGEAYRHFQLLLSLAENEKMKAISLSAMGCIQAEQNNYDKACEYFLKAYSADPTCVDPVLKTLAWPRFP